MPELAIRPGPALLRCGARPAAVSAIEDDLLRRWSEPHRRYHDLRHLAEVLDRIDDLASEAAHPDVVRLAAWWHDAVHDGEAGADERASARLAADQLDRAGVPPDVAATVVRLVLLTIDHRPQPDDPDGAVLCDADLGILAAPAQRYAQYVRAVRREYAHVPDELFRAGRSAVLRTLLARPRLFHSDAARSWEPRARTNVTAELSVLDARPG